MFCFFLFFLFFVLLQWLTVGKWFLFWSVLRHEAIQSLYSLFCSLLFLSPAPMSKFLPQSICSVQLDMASVKNKLGTYSPWTRAESRFWNTFEMCYGAPGGITSIVCIQLQQPCCKWNTVQTCFVKSGGKD